MIYSFGNNSNYPPGAENDPRAPWNQEPDTPDCEEFNVEGTANMTWKGTIETDEYDLGFDDKPCLPHKDATRLWQGKHYTPKELLDELAQMCTDEIGRIKSAYGANPVRKDHRQRIRHLERVKEDCGAWTMDDFYVEED